MDAEIQRLWTGQSEAKGDILTRILPPEALAEIDPFDRVQLAETIRVCRASRSLSEAGRVRWPSRVRDATGSGWIGPP
ncbi:MAG: hypothetical protein QM688_14935 [Sphingomonas bacterium]